VVGGLLLVVRVQRSSQQLVENVKRGLLFGPFQGAIIALFVYLAFLTGLISFNVTITSEIPEFVWPFPSVNTSKPAIRGRVKTGHMAAPETGVV
jgi:hypothetical protein